MAGQEFHLVVKNPGEPPRELVFGDADAARKAAAEETRPGGFAELMDETMGRTVWIRDGSTGQELQPGK